jgi:hypothetical protein
MRSTSARVAARPCTKIAHVESRPGIHQAGSGPTRAGTVTFSNSTPSQFWGSASGTKPASREVVSGGVPDAIAKRVTTRSDSTAISGPVLPKPPGHSIAQFPGRRALNVDVNVIVESVRASTRWPVFPGGSSGPRISSE